MAQLVITVVAALIAAGVRTCGSRVVAQNAEMVAQSAFTEKGCAEGLWPARRIASIHSLFARHKERSPLSFR